MTLPVAPSPRSARSSMLLGLIVASAVGIASMILGPMLGGISALLIAIVAGIAVRNIAPPLPALQPGLAVASKSMLRWGVVLLGLQLTFQSLIHLGPGVLVIVACAVAGTFVLTRLYGRMLGVDPELTTLIAAGFSICGAAAVAGMQGVVKAKEEKVAAAIAMVVLFGTLMIPTSLGFVSLFRLDPGASGTLIGGAVHEVAQVVAAAGIAGGEGLLAIAVPIKLARVATLAPMVAAVSWGSRSKAARTDAARPPIVPLFVVGFLVAMVIASTGLVHAAVLGWAKVLQQFLLASAMFALGMGVHVRSLIALGAKPILLSLLSTVTIVAIVGAGIMLGLGA